MGVRRPLEQLVVDLGGSVLDLLLGAAILVEERPEQVVGDLDPVAEDTPHL